MIPLLILAPLILFAALGAALMARPVHAALMLALALSLVAALFVVADAEFLGLVQLLVYVGAVAVLIVFALLLTRPEEGGARRALGPALLCAVPVGAVLVAAVAFSPSLVPAVEVADRARTISVAELGEQLFTTHVAAVLAVGVLLTAVLIGAALLAREHEEP